jgi:hypothetical protein
LTSAPASGRTALAQFAHVAWYPVTVDPDVHTEVVAATAAEGFSVSSWMIAAARRPLRVRSGLAAVAEWEAENGPLTGQELDAPRRRADLADERRTA